MCVTEDKTGGTNHWKCEFCETDNFNLSTENWEKPAENDVTYLLEEAPAVDKSKLREDDHNVIFAIDTSGSMSTTEQVVACDFSFWS